MRLRIGTGVVLFLLVVSTVGYAQSSTIQSEHEAHHPAAATPSPEMRMMCGPGMMGNQGMTGGQGMMGGMPMMAMPMCAAMMGGFQDPRTAAKMLQMQAEMMRSNAAIMEKYAKQLESAK